MQRRSVIVSLAVAGAVGHTARVHAQPSGAAIPRIGVLSFGDSPSGTDTDPIEGLRDGLRALGYEDRRNIAIENRYAEGRGDRLAAQVDELIRSKVDVIFAGGPVPLQAARTATRTIPIIALGGGDPVREGWAQTLARPGGNVTGFTVTFPELGPKLLEILHQGIPGLERVAVLFAPAEIEKRGLELATGARALGLTLRQLEIRGPGDFEAAFNRAVLERAQSIYAVSTNTIVAHRSRLAELSVRHRLPSIGEFPLLAAAGFLMSYGADLKALASQAARYVDKILKGARPGDLPVARPTEFELVINRKTERRLGITLPQRLLMRANRVID